MSCLQRDSVKVISKFQKLFYGFSYVYVVRIFSQCVSSISESKVSDLSFQSYISYSNISSKASRIGNASSVKSYFSRYKIKYKQDLQNIISCKSLFTFKSKMQLAPITTLVVTF